MTVYCIGSVIKDDGPCKIGSTNNLKRRLRELQTGSAKELGVLWERDGGPKEEQVIAGLFEMRGQKIRGEWFSLSEDDFDLLVELFGGVSHIGDSFCGGYCVLCERAGHVTY
jgi:Meiotically Up-regulated Gene 113 (MUG113) protein